MHEWYQLTIAEVLKELKTSLQGLTNAQVLLMQKEFGKNVLQEAKQKSEFAILIGQFKDAMIITLMLAVIISFFVDEHTDPFVTLAILIGNEWIGFCQENNAKEAMRMLQKMAAQ
ncbi:MAG: cation-transporting P-type ATPase [Ferruginibacter sp.]